MRHELGTALPEWNASNRVLAKVGFEFDGETPEAGVTAWRFRHARR